MAAELLHNGRDFAGGNALDVHFGQREFQGLFTANALFERRGEELNIAPDLRDAEGDRPQAGGQCLGFEAIGVSLACFDALVRLRLEHLTAFLAHGFVDQKADAFGQALGAFIGEQLQNGLQEFRIGLVGHVVVCWMFVRHPNRQSIWPALDQFNRGAVPLGAAALRLAALAFAPPPPRGLKKEDRHFTETFLHPHSY